MITHRMATQQPEPAVTFYKIIALSFLSITVVLLGIVVVVTSKKATITILAKEDAKTITVPIYIGGVVRPQTVAGTVTSSKMAWTETYQPTGNRQEKGTAMGEIIIYNKQAVEQPLIAKTRFQTEQGVLFRLRERVVVPANGQIIVTVYADTDGKESEIGPSQFFLPALNAAKQKVIFAESKTAMRSGSRNVGILSEADIKSAKENFAEKVREHYLATFEGDGKVVAVEPVSLSVSGVAGSEVSEFTVSGTSTVVAVTYSPEDLLKVINQTVAEAVDATAEKFLSVNKEPQLTIKSYDVKTGEAELSARQDVVVTLDANVEKLSPEKFLSRHKDEIERYILGLDHVANVEVKFSPAWISTAPTVVGKIRVVVKNIR